MVARSKRTKAASARGRALPVEFARLGRVSLMYRTLDGSETGYWDADKKDWVVDDSYAEAVEEALASPKATAL